MIKRYSTSVCGAFAITFALFLGMNYLVSPEEAEKPEEKSHPPIIIGTIRDVIEPRKKIEPPEKIIDDVELTQKPRPPKDKATKNVINFMPPTRHQPIQPLKPTRIGLANGEIQPLRKFAPAYPRVGVNRGIEGYVVVKFTVNKMGAVENIVIVESTNGIFNDNTISAVEKYKYKPRVIDGEAVEVHGVMEKVSFKIDNS